MAGGLLRVQHARDRRAQAVAATALAAVATAGRALSAAEALRLTVGVSEAAGARNRWDRSSGTLVTAAVLADLRKREMAGQGALLRLDARIAIAHQSLVAAEHEGRVAAESAKVQAMVTLRRTRLATECRARLDRSLAQSEDAALEDEREIQAAQSW